MRRVLRNTEEVCHYWANQVQSEGKAGNVFFEGEYLYSYGRHFCIGRVLPFGRVVFTTQSYSVSTSRHQRLARSAAQHRLAVYCENPARSASYNMTAARRSMETLLGMSVKPRIHKATRVKHRAAALECALAANAYLAALDPDERGLQTPIDTSNLDSVTAELAELTVAREKLRLEQVASRRVDLEADLVKWRTGEVHVRTALHELPAALRLNIARMMVQTSHGAEIPLHDAMRLWALIHSVMRGSADYTPRMALGAYRLTKICTDGSIVVGCHDIAYSEIEGIAKELGLLEPAAA